MNKQELLKQADYNFQRGNRKLAGKYLADLLETYPNEEAAWILLAKVVEEKERKIECYEQALKLNPGSSELRIALARLQNPNSAYIPGNTTPRQSAKPTAALFRATSVILVVLFGLGSTTYAIAKNNPTMTFAKLILFTTATPVTQPIEGDLAAQTRAEVSEKYPQYASLVDSLLVFAIDNAESGMDGAPQRPGDPITPSDKLGADARAILEKSMPQPGSLTSVTLSEQQLTSWLSMEMQNSPDLPFSDIQVYLRDDKIQIWSVVAGASNSTAALIVGGIALDYDSKPYFEVESVQIGQQVIPDFLVSQAAGWVNELLLDEINKQTPNLQIMNINISSGLITISGMQ